MANPTLSRQRPVIQAGGIRRSFTQPPRSLSFHEKAGLDPSDSAADILYSHPQARIVSFTPPTDGVRSVSSPGPVDLDYPVDTIETLPWKSPNEQVLASGSLVIEKIRGSTNFLKSGTKPLHALMRNSQCWCVDGKAMLVMRVGAFKYYRIELPYTTEEDKAEVQQLKDVLKRILRFEATPCPFKRGFHVDLPQSATTPRKKGPWKRRPGSFLSSPSSASPSPLSPKKSRGQAAPGEQEAQWGVQSSFENFGVPYHDGIANIGTPEYKKPYVQQLVAAEEDGTCARTDSDIRDGRQRHDVLPNLTLAGDNLTDWAPEAGADAREEPQLGDDHLVTDLAPLVGHPRRPSDSLVEGNMEDTKEVRQPSAELDTSNTASFSLEIEDAESVKSWDLFDQQSDLTPDKSLSTVSPVVVLDHLRHEENVLSSHLDQPTAGDLADATDPHEGLTQSLQVPVTLGVGVSAGAGENGSDLEVQPADSDGPVQLHPRRAAHPISRVSFSGNPCEGSADWAVDDFDIERMQPQSNPQSLDAVSVSSCAESFHSIASSEGHSSILEANLAESSEPSMLSEVHDPLAFPHIQHRRDISETASTINDARILEAEVPVSPLRPFSATSECPSTPALLRSSASDSSWPEVETPTAVATDNDLCRRTKKKRSFSPLPPSSTLFSDSPQSSRGNHLTGAILQRACNLALGKPVEVVFMLVHLFARIASGATVNDLISGDLFRLPPDQDSTLRRDQRVRDRTDGRKGEASDEEDYGVPIRARSSSAAQSMRKDDDTDSLFDLD